MRPTIFLLFALLIITEDCFIARGENDIDDELIP